MTLRNAVLVVVACVLGWLAWSPGPAPEATASLSPVAAPPSPGPPRPPGGPPPPEEKLPETAPDFTLETLDGGAFNLSEARAKGPVVLVFYKTECTASETAVPVYNRFQELYGTEGFTIMGVVQNGPGEVRGFCSARGVKFPQATDAAPYEVSKRWKIRYAPTLVLVDGDGQVRAHSYGWRRDDTNGVSRELASLLGTEYRPISEEGDGLPASVPG